MATTREKLRELIDRLPEEQLERAARLLAELGNLAQSFDEYLASVPEDDEPTSDEDRKAIAEAREDYRAGRTIPLSEILRRQRSNPPR
jgi:hypothetical protein